MQSTESQETMKAAAVDEKGGPEAVHTKTVPRPQLGEGEVLIEVSAAGVGVWDTELVAGEFSDGQRGKTKIYGADGAGTVVDVGAGVTSFHPGDRVYGFGFGNEKGGFFAELAAIPEENVASLPDGLSLEEAGALAVSGLTALEGLNKLKMKSGDALLLVGASGGVGHIALQLAKRAGFRVFAVASGADGVELCKRLGADDVVDGKSDRDAMAEQAKAFAPGGFGGALVFAGDDDGWSALTELVDGRIAHPNGVEPKPQGHRRARVIAYDGNPERAVFTQLNDLIARGPFHVELARIYDSLDDTPAALRAVSEHHVGKVVVRVH